MNGPAGGHRSAPRRSIAIPPPGNGVPPGFSRADQDRIQAEMAAAEQADIEAHFRVIGALKRHGIYDHDGCPKCKQKTLGKVHCTGRDRGQTEGFKCYILGDHLHGQCGTCKFVWVERAADDTYDIDWRGGKRFDELDVDGALVEVPVASAAAMWGVGADSNSNLPLVNEERANVHKGSAVGKSEEAANVPD